LLITGFQELSHRRGTSALYDSLAYLSSDKTPWNHTLVAWTGEIKRAKDTLSPPGTPGANTSEAKYLNKNSAPIPVNPTQPIYNGPTAESIWVPKEDQVLLERQLARDAKCRTVPVWLTDEVETGEGINLNNQERWRQYAEHDLYSLCHYKMNEPTDGKAERKWWADYYLMNRMFADKILEVYKPGDVVWIHDYHLLLLPALLRQQVPSMYIGFFLHVPFPSSEFFRCLSRRKEILEGVLGANMIGFQTFAYARHFRSCCTRILGFDSSMAGVDAYGTHVPLDSFPIGIDAEAVEKEAFNSPIIDENMKSIRQLYAGKKIIVGRDRLDSVRGVVQKLEGFEMFLESYPEWRDKVVLIQVTSPSSAESEEESESYIQKKVSELIARINGLYGSLSFSPVQHYPQYLQQDEYLALLRVADVGLITSVRDGMNTTSLEYVICQKDSCGPLILSEFSGTAHSMGSVIQINPWDTRGIATTLNEALTMAPAKKEIAEKFLYQWVTKNNMQNWSNTFVNRLLTNLSSFSTTAATPLLDRVALLSQYKRARKRLFMFDYDGTLTPIVREPSAAIPTDRVIRTIKTLAADPRNAVWIISGRDQEFLNTWLGDISELGLSAEHGSFMRQPKSDDWENLTEKFDMSWQKEVIEIFDYYSDRTQGNSYLPIMSRRKAYSNVHQAL
jgi:trehalose 6-phosphate synthase/phosphatase